MHLFYHLKIYISKFIYMNFWCNYYPVANNSVLAIYLVEISLNTEPHRVGIELSERFKPGELSDTNHTIHFHIKKWW